MQISKRLLDLNVDNILSLTSEEKIYKYYLGNKFKFDKPFSSPFRRDRNPSFIVSSLTKYYRDFATGEAGNCFNFVQKLYSIGFNECLIQIVYDLGLNYRFHIPNTQHKKSKQVEIKNISNTDKVAKAVIKVKTRKFNEDDLKFWNSYGISLKYLKLGNIYALDYFYLNGKYYKAVKYSYVFVEKKDDQYTYKIYQPYSNLKWISNNNYSVWELWNLLPNNYNRLIITSSRKDALSIIENNKIPAVALQSEITMPKDNVMREILRRFEKVYVLFDNDYNKDINIGQQAALKLVNKYGLTNVVIPEEYKSKDYSDLVLNHGRAIASNILKGLL